MREHQKKQNEMQESFHLSLKQKETEKLELQKRIEESEKLRWDRDGICDLEEGERGSRPVSTRLPTREGGIKRFGDGEGNLWGEKRKYGENETFGSNKL